MRVSGHFYVSTILLDAIVSFRLSLVDLIMHYLINQTYCKSKNYIEANYSTQSIGATPKNKYTKDNRLKAEFKFDITLKL